MVDIGRFPKYKEEVISRISEVAMSVCGREIVYINNNKCHIYEDGVHKIAASTPTVAFHEICHWIAAEPSMRDKPNFGMPVSISGVEYGPMYVRMQTEELIACGLSRLVYDKYFSDLSETFLLAKADGFLSIAKDCEDMFENYAKLEERCLCVFNIYCK